MKTFVARKDQLEKKWYLIDAQGKVLGRLASRISLILQGKHRVEYTPFLDTGDFVVVINADKIKITGKKEEDKKYFSHSGYPGKLKERTLGELLAKKPEEVFIHTVRRMLPKTRLGRQMLGKLKVYRGKEHPHASQQPEELTITQGMVDSKGS